MIKCFEPNIKKVTVIVGGGYIFFSGYCFKLLNISLSQQPNEVTFHKSTQSGGSKMTLKTLWNSILSRAAGPFLSHTGFSGAAASSHTKEAKEVWILHKGTPTCLPHLPAKAKLLPPDPPSALLTPWHSVSCALLTWSRQSNTGAFDTHSEGLSTTQPCLHTCPPQAAWAAAAPR